MVYRTYYGISYEQMGKCEDRLPKYVICAGPHKVEDHQCGVVCCHKKPGKICIYLKVQCANCGGSHPTDSTRCAQTHKAEIVARKRKTLDKSKAKAVEDYEENQASHETNPEPEMGIDPEAKRLTRNKEGESSEQDESPEEIDYTKSV